MTIESRQEIHNHPELFLAASNLRRAVAQGLSQLSHNKEDLWQTFGLRVHELPASQESEVAIWQATLEFETAVQNARMSPSGDLLTMWGIGREFVLGVEQPEIITQATTHLLDKARCGAKLTPLEQTWMTIKTLDTDPF